MKIIQPAHNKPAAIVKTWGEIKEEAETLREFVNEGKFEGHYEKAYAISHAQVSNDPKHFFVLHKDHEKLFGTWCVINQGLAPKGKNPACREPVYFKEACMSFPFRKPQSTERFNKIRIKYKVPFLITSWRTKVADLEGLPAFIAQHEAMHAAGKNIYGLE